MTCTRPRAESQKNPLTRGRRPHMTLSRYSVGTFLPLNRNGLSDCDFVRRCRAAGCSHLRQLLQIHNLFIDRVLDMADLLLAQMAILADQLEVVSNGFRPVDRMGEAQSVCGIILP